MMQDVPKVLTPEGLATRLVQALQAEGFDAFTKGNPYNISHKVWPILARILREELPRNASTEASEEREV